MTIQRPEEAHHHFAEAVNSGDAAGLAALYAPDAAIVERDGSLTVGPQLVRHLEDLVAMRPAMDIVESRAFEHGDLALLCSEWKATVTTPDGEKRSMEFRGCEVLGRQPDGTWLLVLDNPWGVAVEAR